MALPAPQVTPDAEVGVEATPSAGEGNAAEQASLGLGEAPAEPAVQSLVDAVGVLWSARVDGVDDVWDKAAAGAPPSLADDLLVAAAIAGVLAVTGTFISPIVAATIAATGATGALETALQGAIGSLVSAGEGQVRDAVTGTLEDAVSSETPSVDAYFLATKAALRMEGLAALGAWRGLGSELVGVPGGLEAIRALSAEVQRSILAAEAAQMQRSVVEWMNALARAETGVAPGEAIDPSKAGSGRTPWEWLWGGGPAGILRLSIRLESPTEPPQLVSARVSGVNESLLAVLSASEARADQCGLALWIGGPTPSGIGQVELARDERGEIEVVAGQEWLARWGAERQTAEESAASRFVAEVAGVPLRELPLEVSA
jgi:hypothetical protein